MQPKISVFSVVSPPKKSDDQYSLDWYFPQQSFYFFRNIQNKILVVDLATFRVLQKSFRFCHHVIVLTKNKRFTAPKCTIARSIEDVLMALDKLDKVAIVIGGIRMLNNFLKANLVDKIHLTRLDIPVKKPKFPVDFLRDFVKLDPISKELDFDDFDTEHEIVFESYVNKKYRKDFKI